MRIETARYITEDDIKIVTLGEITKKKYEANYKGKLYCPTENCGAKVSFSSGKSAHYKTWRFSKHYSECTYHFERTRKTMVYGLANRNLFLISKERKHSALLRAYKTMIEGEKELPTNTPINAPGDKIKPIRKYEQLKLFDLNGEENKLRYRGKLFSRFVHTIQPSDVGNIRLIKGYVKDIELYDDVAEMIVGYDDKEMTISFEERFQKEPLNKSYLNKFWAIVELLNKEKQIIFTGVGEVREDRETDYNLSIYLGSDFKVNGEDLFNIARKMKFASIV